jgi:hypothetical protein
MERVQDQREMVEAMGIAVSENPHATVHIAGLYADSLLPDYDELLQICSFIDYKIVTVYNESWQVKLSAMKIPEAPGHNTVHLRKGHTLGAEGWFYKMGTWSSFGWPNPANKDFRPLSLVEVLDHAVTLLTEIPPQWTAWKENASAFRPLLDAAILGPRSRPSSLAAAERLEIGFP